MATGNHGTESNLTVWSSPPRGVEAEPERAGPGGASSGLLGPADGGGGSGSLIRPCLLLLLHDGPSHGYELAKRLNRLGVDTDPRTVYRNLEALHRLELLSWEWDTQHIGPARRTYGLTASGIEELERSAERLRLHVAHVCHLLTRFDTPSPAPPPMRRVRWRTGRRSSS